MPKGKYTRPGLNKKKGYQSPDGDRMKREAFASGDPKQWLGSDTKVTRKQWEEELRMRERVKPARKSFLGS